jgi:hypothetical protein
MRDERFEVSVTFDAERGYIASAPELRQPIVALSLGGLRRKVQALMVPDEPIVVLSTGSPSASAIAAGRSWYGEPGISLGRVLIKLRLATAT